MSGRLGIGNTIALSGFIGGAALLLIPLAPVSFPIPFLITSVRIVALAIVTYNVTAISLIQTLTPDRLLGRANASRRWIVWGTIPLGSLTGGVLSTVIGLADAVRRDDRRKLLLRVPARAVPALDQDAAGIRTTSRCRSSTTSRWASRASPRRPSPVR